MASIRTPLVQVVDEVNERLRSGWGRTHLNETEQAIATKTAEVAEAQRNLERFQRDYAAEGAALVAEVEQLRETVAAEPGKAYAAAKKSIKGNGSLPPEIAADLVEHLRDRLQLGHLDLTATRRDGEEGSVVALNAEALEASYYATTLLSAVAPLLAIVVQRNGEVARLRKRGVVLPAEIPPARLVMPSTANVNLLRQAFSALSSAPAPQDKKHKSPFQVLGWDPPAEIDAESQADPKSKVSEQQEVIES